MSLSPLRDANGKPLLDANGKALQVERIAEREDSSATDETPTTDAEPADEMPKKPTRR